MSVMGNTQISSTRGACEATNASSVHKPQKKGSDSLNLLLFSVGGVRFGVDADQVAEITAYDGDPAENLFWFHEEMDYGAQTVRYLSPTIVTIRTGDVSPYRVIIDSMEDIAEFSQNDICLFPSLVEPFSLQKGMWGILLQHGSMVVLLDFQRLLKERKSGVI